MSNVILAVLTEVESTPAVLSAAKRLSDLFGGAYIEALVVRVSPISTIMVTEEVLTPEQEKEIRSHENKRADLLKAAFDRWQEERGGGNKIKWINAEGVSAKLVNDWGERADYIIVSKPVAGHGNSEYESLHSALFASERPVLVVPPQMNLNFGEKVAVAWREDKFTLHAVRNALQFIPQSAQIHLLVGHTEGSAPSRVPEILSDHDMNYTVHELILGKDTFGAQLLAKAHELRVDMLVMGAFVHHSWRRMLFGGVTNYMLGHADLPVLMRH